MGGGGVGRGGSGTRHAAGKAGVQRQETEGRALSCLLLAACCLLLAPQVAACRQCSKQGPQRRDNCRQCQETGLQCAMRSPSKGVNTMWLRGEMIVTSYFDVSISRARRAPPHPVPSITSRCLRWVHAAPVLRQAAVDRQAVDRQAVDRQAVGGRGDGSKAKSGGRAG